MFLLSFADLKPLPRAPVKDSEMLEYLTYLADEKSSCDISFVPSLVSFATLKQKKGYSDKGLGKTVSSGLEEVRRALKLSRTVAVLLNTYTELQNCPDRDMMGHYRLLYICKDEDNELEFFLFDPSQEPYQWTHKVVAALIRGLRKEKQRLLLLPGKQRTGTVTCGLWVLRHFAEICASTDARRRLKQSGSLTPLNYK